MLLPVLFLVIDVVCIITPGRHVGCTLIGMSHKLAAYNSFEQGLSTSWWIETGSAQVSLGSE